MRVCVCCLLYVCVYGWRRIVPGARGAAAGAPPCGCMCVIVRLCHCVRRSMYVYVNVLVQECVAQGCSVSVCNNVCMAVRQRASV